MPQQGIGTLSGQLWRASKDKRAREQLDCIWALGKTAGDRVRDGVGEGEMTGYLGGIYCNSTGREEWEKDLGHVVAWNENCETV